MQPKLVSTQPIAELVTLWREHLGLSKKDSILCQQAYVSESFQRLPK